jgi:hypothetical protein
LTVLAGESRATVFSCAAFDAAGFAVFLAVGLALLDAGAALAMVFLGVCGAAFAAAGFGPFGPFGMYGVVSSCWAASEVDGVLTTCRPLS